MPLKLLNVVSLGSVFFLLNICFTGRGVRGEGEGFVLLRDGGGRRISTFGLGLMEKQ
jgi:hypothetical protein